MFHPNASSTTLQEGFTELLRIPLLKNPADKKIKKEDVVVQFKDFMEFFQGEYL